MGELRGMGLRPRRKPAPKCYRSTRDERLNRPRSAPQLRPKTKTKKKKWPAATATSTQTSIKICLPPNVWPRVGRENSPDDCVGQKKSIEPKPVFIRLQRPTSAHSGLHKNSKYIILDHPDSEFNFKLNEVEKREDETPRSEKRHPKNPLHFKFEETIRPSMRHSKSARKSKSPMNLFGKLRGSKVKQKMFSSLPHPLTIKRISNQKTISMRQLDNVTIKRPDTRSTATRLRKRLTHQPRSMMTEQSLSAYRRRHFFRIAQTRPFV